MTQARGVFPLPQTTPQISGRPSVITLASGCMYVFPSGNYLATTGPNTALEWFDPLATQWRPMAPSQNLNDFDTDPVNYRFINMTGGVTTVSITGAGSAGTNGIGPVQTGTTVAFSASPTGAWMTAQGYAIVGGSVPAPTVTQAGSGYVVPPLVCCDPPPVGGIQATFVATINASGGIATVTQVNPGAGYVVIPQFYIIPQPQYYQGTVRWPGDSVIQPWPAPGLIAPANVWPGTIYQPNIPVNPVQGALLTGNALTGTGTLTGIVIIYNGGGYTTAAPPTVSFAGGTLTGMTATTTVATTAANDTSYLQDKVT